MLDVLDREPAIVPFQLIPPDGTPTHAWGDVGVDAAALDERMAWFYETMFVTRELDEGFVDRMVAPMSIPIGTQALHAVGAAMASSWLGDGGVTVAFVGDGATSEGDVHEALNLAAVRDAPCIFYVQNNGWAISTPLAEQ